MNTSRLTRSGIWHRERLAVPAGGAHGSQRVAPEAHPGSGAAIAFPPLVRSRPRSSVRSE
jgi:hypothetical protein